MRLRDTILFGVSLGYSRAQVLATLGVPYQESFIADDNKTSLTYSPESTNETGLFGPPPGGAVIRLDSNGRVDQIRARGGSLKLGRAETVFEGPRRDVLACLAGLNPFCEGETFLSFLDGMEDDTKLEPPVSLTITSNTIFGPQMVAESHSE